jgi:hypothetical protein
MLGPRPEHQSRAGPLSRGWQPDLDRTAPAGRFEPLVRAGQAVLLPLPNSGTAQRAEALHHLQLAGLLGAGGEALSGSLLGGAAGLAAPAVVARGLLSSPVQSYLSNRAAAGAPRLAATPQGQYSGFADCLTPKGRAIT